ncbi:radical SAM protein [Kitasatospora sp. NPDC086801]|uniref:radical SAM protein n=1 Tax=Kitasatospora sp. NPDC086801 TaxID=3364066 RepID=UPI0037FFEA05
MNHVEILPPHPLRADYTRHLPAGSAEDLFQRRLEPQNFNGRYLDHLVKVLEQALDRDPQDGRSAYMLAFCLLQNSADRAAVYRANALLDRTRADGSTTRTPGAERLRALTTSIISRMERPLPGIRPIAYRVNWSINNRCPMACRGCYNPFAADQISAETAYEIIDRLVAHGTTDVVVSGGDPLLWPPVFDVVDRMRAAGLRVALDTTGYTLDTGKIDRLKNSLDSIRLPLDGSTPDIQRAFRRNNDPDLVSRLQGSLRLCDDAGFHAVRVHTVVSKQNVDDLPAIAEKIFGHQSVKQWVLFQWWGRRAARHLVKEMAVSREEVLQAVTALKADYPGKEIHFAAAEERELVNFFIQSSGQVVTMASGHAEEFIVGALPTGDLADIVTSPILDFSAIHCGLPVSVPQG